MTNLLIAYPDIPFFCQHVEGSAETYNFDVYNSIAGPRYAYTIFEDVSGNKTITYSFDSGFAAQQSKANYLILARADILRDKIGVTTFKLESSANAAFSSPTTHINDTSFATQILYGPRSQDAFYTFTLSAAQRYWRVTLIGGLNAKRFSKISFGQMFDFGQEPQQPYTMERLFPRDGAHYAGSGIRWAENAEYPMYRFKFHWERISDSTMQDFMAKIGRYIHTNLVHLFTQTNHGILDNHRLIHCKITEMTMSNPIERGDRNDIELTFEEVIG